MSLSAIHNPTQFRTTQSQPMSSHSANTPADDKTSSGLDKLLSAVRKVSEAREREENWRESSKANKPELKPVAPRVNKPSRNYNSRRSERNAKWSDYSTDKWAHEGRCEHSRLSLSTGTTASSRGGSCSEGKGHTPAYTTTYLPAARPWGERPCAYNSASSSASTASIPTRRPSSSSLASSRSSLRSLETCSFESLPMAASSSSSLASLSNADAAPAESNPARRADSTDDEDSSSSNNNNNRNTDSPASRSPTALSSSGLSTPASPTRSSPTSSPTGRTYSAPVDLNMLHYLFAMAFAALALGAMTFVGVRVQSTSSCPVSPGYSWCALWQDFRSVLSFILGAVLCCLFNKKEWTAPFQSAERAEKVQLYAYML